MYTDQERLVFGPFGRGDGTEIFADPLAVYRRLVLATEGEHNRLLADTQSTDEQVRLAAEDKLVPAAREALGLVPFNPEDGSGTTDREALTALRAYVEWMNSKKQAGAI